MSKDKVLIVDAHANVQMTLSHLLEDSGYVVEAIRPEQDVMGCLVNGRFHLLILEIDIPASNGLLLLKTIRHCLPALPVIVLTSCPDSQTAVSARQLAINSYLVKPINPINLLRQIENALAPRSLYYR
ncbi:MAG: response regulator [Anaerolineales bacterium]|nr:response regulator [Anaerolineales bacterium]